MGSGYDSACDDIVKSAFCTKYSYNVNTLSDAEVNYVYNRVVDKGVAFNC